MATVDFGKYRLIAELGHGGMADVFLAVRIAASPAGRPLSVIKRLRQSLVEEPEFVAMLLEESRIAVRLDHPNVVRTLEVGAVGHQYYIEMEYLDGQPLHRIQTREAHRIKERRPTLVTPEQQLVVVLEALAGLHHAHELADERGSPLAIVHRDVTPQNLFVTYGGEVKVVDFGIAKAAGRASETRQGVVKGKVRYMAPEQALGDPVDRRADVFAVGILLWEIVTGRRMWRAIDDLEIVKQLAEGKHPASPRSVDPSLHRELDEICQKALARDPERRYPTAEAFRAELGRYLHQHGMLLEGRAALTTSVRDLFADKRAEIQAIIERQLAELDAAAARAEPELPAAFPVEARFAPSPRPPPAITTTSPTSLDAAPRSTPPLADSFGGSGIDARPSRSARRLWSTAEVAMAALLFAALAGAAVWRLRPASSVPAAASRADTLTLRVKAFPAGARVILDDAAAVPAPLTAVVPRDGRDHRVRVEADGFVPYVETVRFEDDLAMSVALQPGNADAGAP
ncbi:MAG: serine/threonine protein kinase [Labilithrix sp.]|nr:serine/threonine protein kinase [Labilithrix sp.]